MNQPETEKPQDPAKTQTQTQPTQAPELDPKEFTGTLEDSFKAATSGIEELSKDDIGKHPTKIYHAREETGRHSDDRKK